MPHAPDSWWEVEVSGDPHTLRFARDVLIDGPMRIRVDGDRHVLTNDEWNRIQDVAEVRAQARALVQSLAGSARIVFGWFAPLEAGHVTRRHPDGKRDYFLEVDSTRCEIRSYPVTLSVTRADGSVEECGPRQEVSPWLDVAADKEDVRRVLRLISQPDLDWVELYRISDVIVGAAGASIFDWVPRKQFDRFKWTANSVGAIGDEARHGRERSSPPSNPMTLPEARLLVTRLARDWLNATGSSGDDPVASGQTF